MIYTSLKKIRSDEGYESEKYNRVRMNLGLTDCTDDPIPLAVIFEANGFSDAVSLLTCCDGFDRHCVIYNVWCAEKFQDLMVDSRTLNAYKAAVDFSHGKITEDQLYWYKYQADEVLNEWSKTELIRSAMKQNPDLWARESIKSLGHTDKIIDAKLPKLAIRRAAGLAGDVSDPRPREVSSVINCCFLLAKQHARQEIRKAQIEKFREVFCSEAV
jgi:hypothetical protein